MTQQSITAQSLIDMFSPIPEENWIKGRYRDEDGKCCAVGFYALHEFLEVTFERCCTAQRRLDYLFGRVSKEVFKTSHSVSVTNINDGLNDAPESISILPTPKQRVLAFLEEAKKHGF